MKDNPFWPSIQAQLTAGTLHGVGRLLIIAVVAPIIEGALINLWTGAYSAATTTSTEAAAIAEAAMSARIASAYFAALAFVAIVHAILALPVLYRECASSPQSMLGKAFLLQEEVEGLSSELRRREITNELVRSAFDRLNNQTCVIEANPRAEAWCLGGFHEGFEPIIEPFLDKIDLALGVRGGKYTLEVYFRPNVVPSTQPELGMNGLSQLAFYGTHKNRCDGVCMPAAYSPAANAINIGLPYEKHIEEDRQLFFNGNDVKQGVYFRRYAPHPILAPCSDHVIGVLVLTSMQDEPFAPNATETLAFLSVLVSNYLAAYDRCFKAHQLTRKAG